MTSEIPYANSLYSGIEDMKAKKCSRRTEEETECKLKDPLVFRWVDPPSQADIAILMPKKFKCITEAI